MIPISWFTSLTIPIGICWYIGNDWRKADYLYKSITGDSVFDEFKKDILETNKEWSKWLFIYNVVSILCLSLFLIYASLKTVNQDVLTYFIGFLIFSSIVYLIFDIIFVKNEVMKDLKDKKIEEIIKDKKTLDDFNFMLQTYNSLEDESLKSDFGEHLSGILKKVYKKRK